MGQIVANKVVVGLWLQSQEDHRGYEHLYLIPEQPKEHHIDQLHAGKTRTYSST